MRFEDLMKDYEPGMSDFQDDHFVTKRGGGTPYGQYKQALREIGSRIPTLRSSYYEREELLLDIEELEKSNELEGRRKEIQLGRLRGKLVDAEIMLNQTCKDFKRFLSHAFHLKKEIGELTPEKKYRLEQELWEYRVREQISIQLASEGRILNTTLEIISALPQEIKQRVMEDLPFNHEDPQGQTKVLIESYLRQSRGFLDQVSFSEIEISDKEIFKIALGNENPKLDFLGEEDVL